MKPRLLIIDDDPAFGKLLATVATGCGYSTYPTTSSKIFRLKMRAWDPTHISVDLKMPKTDGVELLRYVAQEECKAKILLISGTGQRILAAAKRIGLAYGLRIERTLTKPADLRTLRQAFFALLDVPETAPEPGPIDGKD